MHPDFRSAMNWLHTWAGVILGSIMFVMFFMGTLSVFKAEIDQWMLPQTRLSMPAQPPSLDDIYDAIRTRVGEAPQAIRFVMPSHGFPAISVYVFAQDGTRSDLFFDPNTLEETAPMDSLSARFFLYPMHYRLTPLPNGRWFSAVVAMFMLTMMVSGVVIHHKIFIEFFTFRPSKKLPRSSLDLHNLTSVLAMPFHIVITLTGVIILVGLYFEPSLSAAYPTAEAPRQQLRYEIEGMQDVEPIGTALGRRIARLDPMAQTARTLWQGERVADIYIEYPDDKGGVVWLYKSVADQVSSYNMPLQFSVGEGALISTYQTSLGYDVQNVLAGMHLIFFEHWTLRWLYFLAGTAGCIMIATGYIYWLETRRKEHARQGRRSVRFVEGFAIWGIMGLMAATAAFFFINRALPPGLWTWQSIPKPFLEPILFMLVWLCALLHGWVRGPKAWFDQAVLISFLLFGAVCLNWLITGDHPLRALKDGKTAILVMDVLLLCFAAIALAAGMRLRANLQAAGAHATKAAKNVKIGSVRPQ